MAVHTRGVARTVVMCKHLKKTPYSLRRIAPNRGRGVGAGGGRHLPSGGGGSWGPPREIIEK